jgi:DNA-binding MarR family transcriptional regulator
METITVTKQQNPPLSASLPSLPSQLRSTYTLLSVDNQRLFVRVFNWVWSYVFNLRVMMRRGGVLYYYWIVDISRVKHNLTPSELSLLAFIYHSSGCGVNIIHSDVVYNGPLLPDIVRHSKECLLSELIRRGFISRSTRNPQQPYSQKAQHSRQPVFISMTRSGVQTIEEIEKDLYKVLHNSSLNELTGIKKP